MQAWWEALTALERVFAAVAIPATLLLIIQLVTTLIGLGGQDGAGDSPDLDGDGIPDGVELDLDGDGIPDGVDLDGDGLPDEFYEDPDTGEVQHDGFSLRLFSFRGIVAFCAVYGWGALAVSRAGRPWLLALIVGLILGFAAMLLVAVTMQLFVRLQTDGTVDTANAVGLTGEVYLPIPASREGEGKVNVVIQEKMTECAAVTDETESIPTGEKVTVIGLSREKQLIVMRKEV